MGRCGFILSAGLASPPALHFSQPTLSTLYPTPYMLSPFSLTPISPYLCPHAHPRKRSLNRAALEEVLKHESLDRAVCGAQSASTTKCSRPNGSPKGKRSAAKPSSQFSIQCSLTLFFRRNYIKNSAPRAAF